MNYDASFVVDSDYHSETGRVIWSPYTFRVVSICNFIIIKYLFYLNIILEFNIQ